MILSLTFATVVTLPVIAIIGVSELGWTLGGKATSASMSANTTMWNLYSEFGLSFVVPLVIVVGITFVALILVLKKVT